MTGWSPADVAARVEIRALVDEYAWRTDARDHAGFVDLFTENGEVLSTNPGESVPFFRAQGQQELSEVLHGNDQFAKTFHAVGNHRCSIEGDRATGVTYCTAHHLQALGAETESLVMLIRYHDDYRRVAGRWLFSRRLIEMVWVEYIDSDISSYPFRKGSAEWMDYN